jgi:hypothetical protein
MRYRLVFFDMVSRSFVDVSRWGARFVMEASEAGAHVVAARHSATSVDPLIWFLGAEPPMAAVRRCEEKNLRAPEVS